MPDSPSPDQTGEYEQDNRPAVYVEDGLPIFRVSAFGYCIKALAALRAGMAPARPSKTMQAAYDRGHAYEHEILTKFAAETGHTVFGGQEVVEFETPFGKLRGSVDSFVEGYGVVDAKSMNNQLWQKFHKEGLPGIDLGWKYAVQGYGYLVCSDRDVFYLAAMNTQETLTRQRKGRKIEVPNPDYGKLHIEVWSKESLEVEFDLSIAWIVNRMRDVNKMSQGDILTLECPEGEQFNCPVYFIHEEQKGGLLDIFDTTESDLSVMEREVGFSLARAGQNARDDVKRVQAVKDAANAKLLDYMMQHKPYEMKTETVTIKRRGKEDEEVEIEVFDGTDEERDAIKASVGNGDWTVTRFRGKSSRFDREKVEKLVAELNAFRRDADDEDIEQITLDDLKSDSFYVRTEITIHNDTAQDA